MPTDLPTATCLTPPAAGGIAVVQLAGPGAISLIAPLLQPRRTAPPPPSLRSGEPPGPTPGPHSRRDSPSKPCDSRAVRLCRFVVGDEVIDEVIVAARPGPAGGEVVDVCTHGGPRVVQRVLLALRQAGALLVEPRAHDAWNWPAGNPVEHEAMAALPLAQTRAVAVWLARMPKLLLGALEEIRQAVREQRFEPAAHLVAGLLLPQRDGRLLLRGVRVIITGEPNSGKSTLANALAGVERSIVSDVPGTTRDWVEHPSAIEGVPVTWVDTAGIRETPDPLEQEAIRRTHAQLTAGDVVLRVVDLSLPPAGPGGRSPSPAESANAPRPPRLTAWNKSDLVADPGRAPFVEEIAWPDVVVSARSGTGLELLRRRILELTGLADWPATPCRLFTDRQHRLCRELLSGLTQRSVQAEDTCSTLQKITGPCPGAI